MAVILRDKELVKSDTKHLILIKNEFQTNPVSEAFHTYYNCFERITLGLYDENTNTVTEIKHNEIYRTNPSMEIMVNSKYGEILTVYCKCADGKEYSIDVQIKINKILDAEIEFKSPVYYGDRVDEIFGKISTIRLKYSIGGGPSYINRTTMPDLYAPIEIIDDKFDLRHFKIKIHLYQAPDDFEITVDLTKYLYVRITTFASGDWDGIIKTIKGIKSIGADPKAYYKVGDEMKITTVSNRGRYDLHAVILHIDPDENMCKIHGQKIYEKKPTLIIGFKEFTRRIHSGGINDDGLHPLNIINELSSSRDIEMLYGSSIKGAISELDQRNIIKIYYNLTQMVTVIPSPHSFSYGSIEKSDNIYEKFGVVTSVNMHDTKLSGEYNPNKYKLDNTYVFDYYKTSINRKMDGMTNGKPCTYFLYGIESLSKDTKTVSCLFSDAVGRIITSPNFFDYTIVNGISSTKLHALKPRFNNRFKELYFLEYFCI